MKKSQKQFVKKQLLETGKVSRNECLGRFITRLGAIIFDLKEEGLNITGGFEGKDFVYRLDKSQMKKEQVVEHLDNGTVRIRYVEKSL